MLEKIIQIFTDPGDVVIDPCAGSGTTLLAAANCGRKAYGFEIKKEFYKLAVEKVLCNVQENLFIVTEERIKKEERIKLFNLI